MNRERRKAIETLSKKIEAFKGVFEELSAEIESLREDEQDYFDNMPDSFQSGGKGSAAEEAVANLDSAIGALEEIEGQLDEAISALAEATA